MIIIVKRKGKKNMAIRLHELNQLFTELYGRYGRGKGRREFLEEDFFACANMEGFLNGQAKFEGNGLIFSYLYEENEKVYRYIEHILADTSKYPFLCQDSELREIMRGQAIKAFLVAGVLDEEEYQALKTTYFPFWKET